ncbi:RNA polymerase sigma factor [Aeromicrobium sp. Leaf350]|uniref:RNA polymerase sigma factor n=1 Tax=Aeromicrobium sp. Leaf350 TaxID=2876565 RepID=UPI001E376482|nr:sigma-70 family RNA polymerase sigma factor [Aeromicrobium sp. Leaf350]
MGDVVPLRPAEPGGAGRRRPAKPIRRALAAPTDPELLQRCRAGDAAAWDLLVERYERLVFSVALRNGLSRDDAADVTQTTFVALIDALHRLEDDQRLASWLMTVARRQAWRVRSTSRRDLPLEALVEPATEDPYELWDTQTVVHDALATLGGTCRELLLALYFDPEEPSYADIATRLGRSIGGIGPLRGRCLERLRTLMTEDLA